MKDNKGLTELDIEANSLTPKAATVLANSISFNDTLLKLNINGNVLGKMGAQALVVRTGFYCSFFIILCESGCDPKIVYGGS